MHLKYNNFFNNIKIFRVLYLCFNINYEQFLSSIIFYDTRIIANTKDVINGEFPIEHRWIESTVMQP